MPGGSLQLHMICAFKGALWPCADAAVSLVLHLLLTVNFKWAILVCRRTLPLAGVACNNSRKVLFRFEGCSLHDAGIGQDWAPHASHLYA